MLFLVLFNLSTFLVHFLVLSPVLFNRITFLGDFFEYFFTTCGILKPTSGVREVHKVRMVVTKEWRKVKSADAGISMRFSCRDN